MHGAGEEEGVWVRGDIVNKSDVKHVIGVDDDRNVVGVEESKRLLEDIPNKVRDVLGIIVDMNLLKE